MKLVQTRLWPNLSVCNGSCTTQRESFHESFCFIWPWPESAAAHVSSLSGTYPLTVTVILPLELWPLMRVACVFPIMWNVPQLNSASPVSVRGVPGCQLRVNTLHDICTDTVGCHSWHTEPASSHCEMQVAHCIQVPCGLPHCFFQVSLSGRFPPCCCFTVACQHQLVCTPLLPMSHQPSCHVCLPW